VKRLNSILQLREVTKRIGNKIILNNINLTLYKGEVVTFIGDNGMGKSTLLKTIAGLVRLTNGQRIVPEEKLSISYVPEHFPKLNFTVNEYLNHMANMFGDSSEDIRANINKLYDKFNINQMVNTKIENLSKGSMQKIAIIQALIRKSNLIIMDEPLSGQDKKSQGIFIELVNELKNNGVTIVMACHEEYLINTLSDRVIKVENGEIQEYSIDKFNIEAIMLLQLENINNCNTEFFKSIKGITNIKEEKKIINLRVKKSECDSVIFQALKNNMSVIKLNKVGE
jgi:ABC-type multidrug transport system ATPase subunit